MDGQGIHELSAAYALHALDGDEERAFEQHLARCERCRADVRDFQATGALLAYEGPAPEPPPRLKQRILARAQAERPQVVPFPERRRWLFPATAGVAAAAAVTALALGIWAASLSSSLGDERAAARENAGLLAVLGQADAQRIPLEGANGTLVVDDSGRGWLVLFDLDAAPSDKTYEAWIVQGGGTSPAGLFPGGNGQTIVPLREEVPEGASVAVTLERAGGVPEPENDPLFQSARPA